MSRILVSFLGRTQRPDQTQGYREVEYLFADGSRERTAFFGLALCRHIKPDRLVILGTSGSMWDVLVEQGALGSSGEAERLALIEAVENDRVLQRDLDALVPLLQDRLGAPCRLEVISYGRDMQEQVGILTAIAKDFVQDDVAVLDLTHGLRPLPMLGLVSAWYLRAARRVTVEALYYGALDLAQGGIAPVFRLDGLLRILDWAGALHGFDKDGDYAPFASLLEKEGVSPAVARKLSDAAFFERTLLVTQARGPLKEFWREVGKGLPGLGTLFEDSLRQRTIWHQAERLYERQRELAWFHLRNRDYMRSVVLALEGFLTWSMTSTCPTLDPVNYDHRKKVKDEFEQGVRSDAERRDYCLLRDIRNSLTHATRPDRAEVQKAMASEAALRQTLERLYEKVLPR
jgi:CRISPR-associated Csx2 family protein